MSQDLYVIQQEAGDDGLYHWKLFLADVSTDKKGVWHDVVWSADKDVGMEHRGPKPFDEAKSRRFIALHKLGSIEATDAAKVDDAAATTPTPKYDVADKDKNCQTWLRDVVQKLVDENVIGNEALVALDKVPTEEEEEAD